MTTRRPTPPQRPSGLGRGLGELFARTDGEPRPPVPREGSHIVDVTTREVAHPMPKGSKLVEIAPSQITPNPKQPRTVFDEDQLAELAESVKEIGVLQPIVVRPLGGDQYELVMGERRWRAAQRAGLEAVPAIVRRTEDHDLLRDALLENLHRAQLNPLEEAAAYQQMLEEFDCTQEELSRRVKRSRPQISNTLRLLKLPPTVQRRVAAGVLSSGHARALLGIEDSAAQERMAQRIVAEGLSVRAVEELVALGELGAEDEGPRVRAPREVPARASEVAASLSEHFETRVKVDLGKRGGKVTIQFASEEDLERILDIMAVPSDPQ